MKTAGKIALGAFSALAAFSAAGTVSMGQKESLGPFKFLFDDYADEVSAIEKRYPSGSRKHEIIFYGASNFRLWKEMDSDLACYRVQNHGFGGSTDRMLIKHAPRILFSYEPDLVFFQTGSNDYVSLPGTEEEKTAVCMQNKRKMFADFHERLPKALFVVMSGLLLPGRSQYTTLTQEINRQLKVLCDEYNYLTFVDAEEMTFDGKSYRTELFIKDQIHLNHVGQLLWCNGYIRPAIEDVIRQYHMEHLKKIQ